MADNENPFMSSAVVNQSGPTIQSIFEASAEYESSLAKIAISATETPPRLFNITARRSESFIQALIFAVMISMISRLF